MLEDRAVPGFRTNLDELDPIDRDALFVGMLDTIGQVGGLQTKLTLKDSFEIERRVRTMRAENKPKIEEELNKEREAIKKMNIESSAKDPEPVKYAAPQLKDMNDWVGRNIDNPLDPNLAPVLEKMIVNGYMDEKNMSAVVTILSQDKTTLKGPAAKLYTALEKAVATGVVSDIDLGGGK